MDYMYKPPTEMQDRAVQANMEQMQMDVFTQAPYKNARAAMPAQPPELHDAAVQHPGVDYLTAMRHLEYIGQGLSVAPDPFEEYHWLRKITGGGSATLSDKRNVDGSLRTNMSLAEYDALEQLTNAFYDMTENLAEIAPRERELTLYRGIRIPKIEEGVSQAEIEETISRYGDVIPSSASWGMGTPQHFSNAETGRDAAVLHMIVPPDFPLVMLSYPKEKREGDPRSINQSQKEVLVGASTFSDVRLLETEQKEGYRCYHVEVKLNAVARETVIGLIKDAQKSCSKEHEWEESEESQSEESQSEQEQPEILERRFLVASKVVRVFGMKLDDMEVGQKYESLEHPGVWYELKKRAFSSTFELVKEHAEE